MNFVCNIKYGMDAKKRVFSDPIAKERFEQHFLMRDISIEKVLQKPTLDKMPELKEILSSQRNLLSLIMEDEPIYHTAVKAFYYTLKLDHHYGWVSNIGSHPFNVSENTFLRVFELEESGVIITNKPRWFNDEKLDEEDVSRILCTNHKIHPLSIKVHHLRPMAKILLQVVREALLPTKESNNFMSPRESMLIFFPLISVKVNIGRLLFEFMIDTTRTKDSNLPYGRLLTRIFVDKKMDIERFEFYCPTSFFIFPNQSSLKRKRVTFADDVKDNEKKMSPISILKKVIPGTHDPSSTSTPLSSMIATDIDKFFEDNSSLDVDEYIFKCDAPFGHDTSEKEEDILWPSSIPLVIENREEHMVPKQKEECLIKGEHLCFDQEALKKTVLAMFQVDGESIPYEKVRKILHFIGFDNSLVLNSTSKGDMTVEEFRYLLQILKK